MVSRCVDYPGGPTQTEESGLAELAFGFMISSATRSSWGRKSRRLSSRISTFLVQKYFPRREMMKTSLSTLKYELRHDDGDDGIRRERRRGGGGFTP